MSRMPALLLCALLGLGLVAGCKDRPAPDGDRPAYDMHSDTVPNFERGGGGDHGGM